MTAQTLEATPLVAETSFELSFIEDTSLELVGGGTITNTL
jgi:hypothetical protein